MTLGDSMVIGGVWSIAGDTASKPTVCLMHLGWRQAGLTNIHKHAWNHPGITSGDCCISVVEAETSLARQIKDLSSRDPVNQNV